MAKKQKVNKTRAVRDYLMTSDRQCDGKRSTIDAFNKDTAMKRLLVFVVLLMMPSIAEAKKLQTGKNGREVVAHTSRAPVAVHKVFPPYGLHKHVYAGSAKK
jgi:hypothetical protein